MATTKNVTRLPSGKLKYRGEVFSGYNKPKRTPKGPKKSAVLAKAGTTVKLVRFGEVIRKILVLQGLVKMELDAMMFWNIILSLVVAPAAWAFGKMFQEVKRLQILLNKTREEYATRDMVNSENKEVIALLRRLEDKFDRFVERQGWSQQERK